MADPRYPHMMPEDVPVWDAFLAAQSPDWNDILYDVKVGKGGEVPPDATEEQRNQIIALTQKRIDAVIIYDDHHVIVEVKGLADWKAIAQLLGYPYLYERDFNPGVPVQPLLIAASFTPDMTDILDHYELPYVTVDVPTVELAPATWEPL